MRHGLACAEQVSCNYRIYKACKGPMSWKAQDESLPRESRSWVAASALFPVLALMLLLRLGASYRGRKRHAAPERFSAANWAGADTSGAGRLLNP